MRPEFHEFASNALQRRVKLGSSSSAGSGLSAGDILRSGLIDDRHTFRGGTPASPPSLQERVFKALADAKVWTAQVAMHMNLATRDRYFRQLDLLHDCDEWFGADLPLNLESYKTFIRFMLTVDGSSKPSLALSASGNLLGIWLAGRDRLTIEFRPGDSVEWVISRQEGDATERAAGTTSSARLMANIQGFKPETWFKLG